MTGEYDYQIRLACTGTDDFEHILSILKGEHGVREVRTRLLLHDIPMPAARILDPQPGPRDDALGRNLATMKCLVAIAALGRSPDISTSPTPTKWRIR